MLRGSPGPAETAIVGQYARAGWETPLAAGSVAPRRISPSPGGATASAVRRIGPLFARTRRARAMEASDRRRRGRRRRARRLRNARDPDRRKAGPGDDFGCASGTARRARPFPQGPRSIARPRRSRCRLLRFQNGRTRPCPSDPQTRPSGFQTAPGRHAIGCECAGWKTSQRACRRRRRSAQTPVAAPVQPSSPSGRRPAESTQPPPVKN